MKILVCCGNGVGSSLIMKLKTTEVLKKHNSNATIDHASLGDAESIGRNYDVILCPLVFASKLEKFADEVIIIGVKNVLKAEEIEAALLEYQVIS